MDYFTRYDPYFKTLHNKMKDSIISEDEFHKFTHKLHAWIYVEHNGFDDIDTYYQNKG